MFSIITATYNAAVTIQDCLESVVSQGVACEHLIIDGASTDGTQEILARLTPDASRLTPDASRLSRFISEPDQGIYDAMNKGLRLATGEVIGILNADDFYASPDVLARVAKVFEDPDIDACYGDLVYVDGKAEGGRRKGEQVKSPGSKVQGPETQNSKLKTQNFQILRYWKSGSFAPEKFYWGWMPPHPTFFVRRRVYEKHGLFNLTLGSAADYELMLRFLLKHRIKVAYIPEVLVHMRAGGVSNASLQNRLNANRMDRKAWEVNGIRPYPWTIPLKPIRKIPQYFLRP